jgi:putative DNA primase/helicase
MIKDNVLEFKNNPPWTIEKVKVFRLTDLGNAERLIDRYEGNIRYIYDWKTWMIWNKTHWVRDNFGAVEGLAVHTVRDIYKDALLTEDPDERKALAKHAMRSESEQRLRAMVTIARAGVSATPEEFDRDPWLFNVQNGTLDLRTGKLQEHFKENLITKVSPAIYVPEAKCSLWLNFLYRVLAGDENLIRFMQKAVGYTLTGNVREQVFFLLYGLGENGKSVFLETLLALLGDYGCGIRSESLMIRRQDQIPADIADLKGKRLAAVSETEDGKRLAEVLVKDMTGGDTLKARHLYSNFFEFKAQFKLWLRANHKPVIRGTDHAIWRRIRLIPFTVKIPEGERDKALGEKLLAELPGILNWALEGCLAWQREELEIPEAVKSATAEYRSEQDVLGQFLEAYTIPDERARTSASKLYKVYRAWAEENGERHVMSQKIFGTKLAERGMDKLKSDGNLKYLGIDLTDEALDKLD